jgi:hypothetical protein
VDQNQIVRTSESVQLNFSSIQNLDYLLLYPEENLQHFFSYRIAASLDGQHWQMLVDKSDARARGAQLDQIPSTQARFLRISGASYACDLEQLETTELSEESYWQAVEEMTREAEPGDLAITAIALFRQERLVTTSTEETTLPATYRLSQNFPNPFNPTTTIHFTVPKPDKTKLAIYDVNGKLVRELVNGETPAGHHKITFDARGLVSGLYFYRLEAGAYISTRKMVLAK